jgi:hypothetical protein
MFYFLEVYKYTYMNKKIKKTSEDNFVPLKIIFNGKIANSIAQIFQAISRLIEAFVDWLIKKLKNNK